MNKNLGGINRQCAAGLAIFALVIGAAAGLFAQPEPMSAGSPGPMETQSSKSAQTPERVMRDWPEAARAAGRAMIEKYGKPDRFSEEALVWYNNTPWKKTVVYGKAWPHFVAMRDKDYLEQTIAYQVPNDKIKAIKRFDNRIAVNQAAERLSARSESESLNFLALNLADEIVNGQRSADEARIFYRKVQRLSFAGKSSSYLDGLRFSIHNDRRYNP
jgi:hypothetical protein